MMKGITNRGLLLATVKCVVGAFAFLFAISGLQTFGDFYRALPALLLAPTIAGFEGGDLGKQLSIARVLPLAVSIVLIGVVLVLVFVTFPFIDPYIKAHLEENSYWGIWAVIVAVSLVTYMWLILRKTL